MTAADFRATLSTLGLTQRGLARLLGVDERTVRKWCAGDRSPPTLVHRVLHLCTLHPALLDWLRGF